MIGFYNYTVIATYVSLASSMAGIAFACTRRIPVAILCLMLSGLLDTFDGKIARTKKDRTVREQRFGVQIDSLCDLVCFGVLPAVIAFFSVTPKLDPNSAVDVILYVVLVISMILYVLGGVIRLSFFNIGEEEKRDQGVTAERPEYTGLPITTSCLIFPLVALLGYALRDLPYIRAICWCASLLIVGFCFVGKFKIKKPTNRGVLVLIIIGSVIAVAVAIVFFTHRR